MSADGRILIDTKINTDGIVSGTDEVIQSARRMAKQVDGLSSSVRASFSRQADSIQKAARAYDEQKEKVNGIREKLSELQEQQIPTEGYKNLEAEIKKNESALNRLIEKKRQLEESGKSSVLTNEYKTTAKEVDQLEKKLNSLLEKQNKWDTKGAPSGRAYGDLEYDIQNITEKLAKEKEKKDELTSKSTEASGQFQQTEQEIDRVSKSLDLLRTKKKQMETDGKAFTIGDTAAIESTTAKLSHEEARLVEMNRSLETSYDSLKNKVEEYGNKISGAGGKAEKAANSTEKLSNVTKKSSNDFKGFGSMMLKYGIGIESLFTLINKLRSALVEGFKNLAQYSTNTNTSISGLMSSLSQCKNSLATAFDPILQAVAPALNYMISLVTAAATAVAQLIAILTGKGTFIKATKVQKDYAKSLKGTGGAAKSAGKDAEGALAPFDKLNVLAEEGAGGGGGGGGGTGIEDMFETVPVDNNIAKAIDSIKDRLGELKDLFKAGFWEGIGDLSVLDSIKNNISSIRDSLVNVFSESSVQEAANRMMDTLAYDMGRITGSFASIGLSILDNITGGFSFYLNDAKERIKQYLISMFDITSATSTILANFSVALAEIFTVLRGDTAKQMTEDIIAIFLDSFMGVTQLAGKFFRDILDTILTPFTENSSEIKEALENFLSPIEEVLKTLSDSVVETFDNLNQMYDEHLAPMFGSIRDGLTEIINTFLTGFNEHLSPVLDKLADKFTEVWQDHVQPMINKAIEVIGKIGDTIKVFWEEILQPCINWIAEEIFPVISPIVEGIGTLFIEGFGLMSDAVNGLLEILEEILDFIQKVFQMGWEDAWETIKGSFEHSVDSFPGKAQDIADRVKEIFTSMVDGIKESILELGEAGAIKPGLLTKNLIKPRSATSQSLIPVHLPRLATGTVVPPRAGEFAAILGDNKRETEVVSPLSTMKQAMLEAMAQAGGMGGGDINLTVNLDGRQIYQTIVKRNRIETDRTGINPLLV